MRGIGLVGIKSTKCCMLRMDHIMCSGIFWSDPIVVCRERTCASMIPKHAVVVHAHSLSSNVVTTFWLLHTGREPPLGLSLSKTRASSSKFHMFQVSSRTVCCKCWRKLDMKMRRAARTVSSLSPILVKLAALERYRTIRLRRMRTEQSFNWSGILSCRTNI